MKNEETRNTTVSTNKCLLQVRNNNKLIKKMDREGRRRWIEKEEEESSEEEDRQLLTEVTTYLVKEIGMKDYVKLE